MKKILYLAMLFAMPAMAQQATVSSFEDTGVEFTDQNYWNGGMIGTPVEGDWGEDIYHCTWTSGLLTGHVDYNYMDMGDYGYDWWGGIALSQRTGTELTNLDDQYNNIVGTGANGSKTFGVIYGDLFTIDVNVEGGATINSLYVVNSAYTMQNVLVGDGYSAKFQNDGDHIYLNITATKADGTEKIETVKLAEFTTELSYISEWTKVDLSGFGSDVTKLTFTFDAHNSGVPLYACIDDIEVVAPATLAVATFEEITVPADGHISVSTEEDDERTSFVSGDFEFASGCMSDWDFWYFFGYANRTETKYETLNDQWNNIVGGGYDGSANYGVAYCADFNGPCYVTVLNHEDGIVVPGFYITNSSWAYTAIKDGNGAKKFEKGDWFLLTITGYDAAGEVTGTKEFYLADLRDEATAYIINDWRYVDLSTLGKVSKLGFALTSTDNGDWGMNTPAYFCFDNFGAEGVEELPESNVTTGVQYVAMPSQQKEQLYDLQGRRVITSTKGIYVKDGKKVVVR